MKAHRNVRVSFVGLGYVGLSTAACFASKGFSVYGIDVDKTKVNMIRRGMSTIHEVGLDSLLHRAIKKGTFAVGSDFGGLTRSKAIFVTVGTPSREDGRVNTEFVEAASRAIGKQLLNTHGYRLIIIKSTVPPGTTEGLVKPILERESGKKAGRDFGLASNPEFLHEGSAIRETLNPEALVIGGHDKRSSGALTRLYAAFYGRLPLTLLTTPSNAEMMKYAINAGRASQVSFINTIANLCSRIPGCDYDEVRIGLAAVAKMDERYLSAGLGFGGSCLPKDCRALVSVLKSANVDDELVASTLRVNGGQVNEAIRLAERLCGSLDGKRVAVLGLAFKEGTDDIRESVAMALTRVLIKTGAEVSVFDPVAMANAKQVFGSQVTYSLSPRDCIRKADCVFVATGWERFKRLKPSEFKELMAAPIIVDGRRIYDPDRFRREGVQIATIGTGPPDEGRQELHGSFSEHRREWHYTFQSTSVSSG